MAKTKLKYFIEFSEIVEDVDNITDEELAAIKEDIEFRIKNFLFLAGADVIQDFKLEFDVEEE